MCTFTISCPLCTHSSFSSVGSLQLSLIRAIDSPIKCPVCHDIVIGIDKFTLHLISHNKIINLASNNGNYGNCNEKNNNIKNLIVNSKDNCSKYTTQFELSEKNILINNCKNSLYQEQLKHLHCIPDKINQNSNDNLTLNNSTQPSYLKNEPINIITPIVVNQHVPENNAITTLKSASSSFSSSPPSSSSSKLALLSNQSHLFPTILSNLIPSNCTIQIEHPDQSNTQEKNLFIRGATVSDVKQSNINNLENNLIFIKQDNNCNEPIKIEENENLDENLCHNYNKNDFDTRRFENQRTQYSDEHRCDICGITFSSIEIFKKHAQIIHQIPLYTIESNLKTTLATKIQSSFSNGTHTLYQCHFCSKSYKIKSRLRLHLKVKHSLNLKNTENSNVEEDCNSFNNTTKLKISEKIDTLKTNLNATKYLDKPSIGIEATELNTETGNLNSLERDNIKEETLPKPWKCDICSKFYTTKYFLKKHQRIHTGETPYKCNICSKSFTFQQSYHKHLLYHSDEKPYVCKTCNRAFKELSTLHNHERIHSGEKPFECEICGKRFRQRVSNYVHQRTHTGARPYSCEMCFRKFRYKVTLRTHKCASNFYKTFNISEQKYKEDTYIKTNNYFDKNTNFKENLTKNNTNLKVSDLISSYETITFTDNNLQKLLQNVENFPVDENNLLNSNFHNVKYNNALQKDENSVNKDKTLDELVAESCDILGIGNFNANDNNQTYHSLVINDTPSPSEQLQNLCLYSPNSVEANLNINEDSIKQLLFEINNGKHS